MSWAFPGWADQISQVWQSNGTARCLQQVHRLFLYSSLVLQIRLCCLDERNGHVDSGYLFWFWCLVLCLKCRPCPNLFWVGCCLCKINLSSIASSIIAAAVITTTDEVFNQNITCNMVRLGLQDYSPLGWMQRFSTGGCSELSSAVLDLRLANNVAIVKRGPRIQSGVGACVRGWWS